MAFSWFKKKQASETDKTRASQNPEESAGRAVSLDKGGLVARLRKGLAKTREILSTDIDALFKGKQSVDEDLLEEQGCVFQHP